jgi:hypothetical protein
MLLLEKTAQNNGEFVLVCAHHKYLQHLELCPGCLNDQEACCMSTVNRRRPFIKTTQLAARLIRPSIQSLE